MLPIHEVLPQVVSLLKDSSSLVLQAEPGAGKSTALPLALLDQLELNGKKILLLEPRRVAVKAIAFYLADQLGESVGQTIGYQIKNDRKVSSQTILEIVTEGILTRRLQQDPELSDIGLVIFDEFHERSIHSDLSLMLCLEVQQALRDDLKLLVMSATIDTKMLSSYMNNAPIIECPGRVFPVELDYLTAKSQEEFLDKQVLRALSKVFQSGDGNNDILVFLPGQGEIRRCIQSAEERYSEHNDLVFLPLFGGLPLAQQELALRPDKQNRRKVIFATNIAETSLTIEGITHVIDSGLERVMSYDPGSGMSRLETQYISKASADQRKGRAGRTQAGHCIRLWSETRHQTLNDFQKEEICISDLSSLVLDLAAWGSSDFTKINWLTPPPEAHFNSAKQVLVGLGMIDKQGNVSENGRLAAELPLNPRLARMILHARSEHELTLACNLAALLSEQDILSSDRHCDLEKRLHALDDYETNKTHALKNYSLNRARIERVSSSARSLKKKQAREKHLTCIEESNAAKLLLLAFPDRLAKQRKSGDGRYLMANGKGVFLTDDDSLFDSPWLVIADCDAQKKEGRIYSALSIDQREVLESFKNQVTEEDCFEIDLKTNRISGTRQKCIGSIVIDRQTISDIPSDAYSRCLEQLIRKQGLGVLNWTEKCETWLARANWLGLQLKDFPSISKQFLVDSIDDWLLPYLGNINSMAALKRVDILELLKGCIDWNQQQHLDKQAPTEYLTPSGKRVEIRYDSTQGPTVSVILQEVFGELSSPMLAGGKVPLRFELLSPAKRPIQTTSDLANFWKTSYFEVAKDMKGRYPKHRWPDKPLEEKAGRSIKRKT